MRNQSSSSARAKSFRSFGAQYTCPSVTSVQLCLCLGFVRSCLERRVLRFLRFLHTGIILVHVATAATSYHAYYWFECIFSNELPPSSKGHCCKPSVTVNNLNVFRFDISRKYFIIHREVYYRFGFGLALADVVVWCCSGTPWSASALCLLPCERKEFFFLLFSRHRPRMVMVDGGAF